uniref:BRCA1-associated ATM activator 1 n=1 Tax=Gouania willdenowi TaxID=441366 RepID=A0A8C5DE80_GOUWI
ILPPYVQYPLGECFTLLPRVCAVLAAGSSLPDDTSLEKLLDWFSELTTAGRSLLKVYCPCLLEFTSTVVNSATSDPCILSFTLKLVGLLASSEDGFIVLQESSVLDLVFNPGHWEKAGHWEDPCVRIGWIQGLRSLLQHTKALCFFVQAGLIEPLLQLQTDTSLFVASAASQILAHILIFYQPSPSLTHNNQSFTTVVMLISEHLKNSLVSGGDAKLHHAQQSLRLLVLLLTRLRPPLRDSLLHAVTDALEELLMTDLTPPLMDVILAAHRYIFPAAGDNHSFFSSDKDLVFHKSYQVLVRWISVCRDPSSIPDQLKQDLLGVVRKRVCDVRWEVRDSTVEFLGRLAAVKVHHTTDTEAQSACEVLPGGSSSITPVLEEALLDPESYVRASAISALAQTQAPGWHEFVVRLLDVLSEDTEGFPRRAVVQYFISWFSSSASRSSLLRRSVRSVLSRGSADLDWEVKVHTLELAKLLLDEALSAHSKEDTAALLETLVEEGVVSVLLSGLVDCDRPVALKACRLLIVLREALCPPSHTDLGTDRETVAKVSFLLPKSGWALEIIKILKTKNKAEEENAATLRSSNCIDELKLGEGYNKGWDGVSGAGCERMSVCELLSNLGLDERVKILNQSSDHVQNSPLSLLQDILSAGGAHTQPNTQLMQEVIVDCY